MHWPICVQELLEFASWRDPILQAEKFSTIVLVIGVNDVDDNVDDGEDGDEVIMHEPSTVGDRGDTVGDICFMPNSNHPIVC